MRAPRVLLAAGVLQALLGVILGLVATSPSVLLPVHAPVVILSSGLALVALATALAVSPAFTGREPLGPAWAWPGPAILLAGDAVLLSTGRTWGVGAGLLLGAAVVAASAARGPRLADARPADAEAHRVGDRLAAAGLAVGLAGVAGGALLLVLPPRGLPVAGIVALLGGGVLPLLLAPLALLLPRLARAPLPRATVLGAALGVLALAAPFLALSFSLPGVGGLQAAASGVLLAEVLGLAALQGLTLADVPDARAERARPFLRAAAVLAPLAGLVLLLSVLHDRPNDLLPVAAWAHVVLAGLLAGAAVAAAAPFLGVALVGRPLWPKLGAAMLVAGLFLLAPAAQQGHSAFPGALLLAAGAFLAARPFLARRVPAPSKGRRVRKA